MTAVWILGGIVLVLIFLSHLRFRIFLGYRDDGLRAYIRVGLFRFQIYPEKRKKTDQKTSSQKKAEAKPEETGSRFSQLLQDRKSAWNLLQEALPAVKELMRRFQEKLQVDVFCFRLCCALEDPADAALFYGHANAVMGAALPLLERWFTIKKKEIEITLDFERDQPQLHAQAQFSLTLGQMLTLGAFALTTGWRFYKTHRGKKKPLRRQEPISKAVSL